MRVLYMILWSVNTSYKLNETQVNLTNTAAVVNNNITLIHDTTSDTDSLLLLANH